MPIRRQWESGEWQSYALRLVRLRHGAQNVQIVPDTVRGDAGIECFTTDGCLYQCYAPEDAADIAKAASAMKAKGRRDLEKLKANESKIAALLNNTLANRWILLCPFLDNKDVISSVREKATEIKNSGLPFITKDFEALVQCQEDFDGEAEQLRVRSLGPPLAIAVPSEEDVNQRAVDDVSKRLSEKLLRAFPRRGQGDIAVQQRTLVRAHLTRENALEDLRINHPTLWERSMRCLSSEEERLVAMGTHATLPSQQLKDSVDRIEISLRNDLPDFPQATITTIAVGTVGDWLMRCPLDFVGVEENEH
jgi:hypothetical protein